MYLSNPTLSLLKAEEATLLEELSLCILQKPLPVALFLQLLPLFFPLSNTFLHLALLLSITDDSIKDVYLPVVEKWYRTLIETHPDSLVRTRLAAQWRKTQDFLLNFTKEEEGNIRRKLEKVIKLLLDSIPEQLNPIEVEQTLGVSLSVYSELIEALTSVSEEQGHEELNRLLVNLRLE